MVRITITMEDDFAHKFIGLVGNLNSVNDNSPIEIESVAIDEIVAYPKENKCE